MRLTTVAARWRFVALTVCLGVVLTSGAIARGAGIDVAVAELFAAIPTDGPGFATVSLDRLSKAAQNVETAGAMSLQGVQNAAPRNAINLAAHYLAAKQQIDRRLDSVFALGPAAAKAAIALGDGARERQTLRNYLRVASQLIDISGRLRYMAFDVVSNAEQKFAESPAETQQLIDLLIRYQSDVGAISLANMAFDQEAGPRPPFQTRVLDLIAATGETEALPKLANFVEWCPPSWMTVQIAETIRRVGLPQDPRPGQDPATPAPVITAKQLRAAVARIPLRSLPAGWEARRVNLMNWLDARIAQGVPPDALMSIGPCSVQAGDWLLMRNPSPYNLFTDLAPGLFTHVGVVAWEKGRDGRGRLVVVDLPEHGNTIPATNVESFVTRTRHYVFLRHQDPAVAKKMGEAAAAVIGNPAEFDLNFRTDRVLELAGQPLAGKKIRTYCAGLLLLCGLATDRPREEFFPISESCAEGLTAENLKTLGMSLGENFVSPSGALFSEKMRLIGRKAPTYRPESEVEEAIYDYFANKLTNTPLRVSQDLFQSLRSKVAAAAKQNQLLAQALAKAVNVSTDIDLVAAARAAAVVETLDDVAYGASGQYDDALAAIKGQGSVDPHQAQRYRQVHSDLYQRWRQNQIHPRMLRIALVQYYSQSGRQQIDKRFFQAPAAAAQR